MLPFAPTLFVRPLTPADSEPASTLINQLLPHSIYSRALTPAEVHAQLFDAAPAGIFPVRWQQHAPLALLRVGELIGLLDAGVGLDSESHDLPDFQPLGLLRLLVLPEEAALGREGAARLLAAAHEFWRRSGVGRVKAYHPSTGYPAWQAGIGLLPADWTAQVQLLAEHDFRYTDRYYCFARSLRDEFFEESAPQSALTLVLRGASQERRYQIFFRRTELIGEARVVQAEAEQANTVQAEAEQTAPQAAPAPSRRIAHLVQWEVEERWRNQDIGRWLLRRIINDAAQQALDQLIVFVRMQQAAAINLLAQHGFVEQAYRGYVLEKTLRA
jgi:ribosomal protein S18 acetylase RimI-like enzyme